MKKLSLLLCLSLLACDIPEEDYVESTEASTQMVKKASIEEIKFPKGLLYVWIDPSTQCKYYFTKGVHQGGISIRYTKEGLPDCPAQESKP